MPLGLQSGIVQLRGTSYKCKGAGCPILARHGISIFFSQGYLQIPYKIQRITRYMPAKEIVAEPYRFRVIDNTEVEHGIIYSRNFKIGGNYADCVNVSVMYKDNQPYSAKIQTLVSDPECSLDKPLDKGEGSILMIKTLLRYINKEIPEITQFKFEDYSNLECGTQDEKNKKRRRARGTHVFPVPLYYFSIAFNGITWYEKHFNAMYKDEKSHAEYRAQIQKIMFGQKMQFNEFLNITTPSILLKNELQHYYENAANYHEFFTSIPKEKRCPLLRGWLNTFMLSILDNVFHHDGWIIDVTTMDAKKGGHRKGRKKYTKYKGSKRRNKTRKDSYYCPIGSFYYSDTRGDMCVDDF